MINNALAYGGDSSLAYTIGASAGANLAIALTLKIVSNSGLVLPKAILASCTASIEPSVIPEKYKKDWHPEEFLDAAFLDRKCIDTCEGTSPVLGSPCLKVSLADICATQAAYGAAPSDPLFSVLLHPELGKLPPTYLVACDKDATYNEICILNDEMKQLGSKVELKVYKGYPHFFFTVPMLKASQEYLDDIVSHIREMVF
jgi:versiconal hemiacetal acetate esterase